ncbi:MAG: folylpolyglutamate synthase/dihydrofolate synthase family protein [Actinomycetota bacterium]
MKYSEAVDFLDGRIVLGVKPSLDRIRALCGLMGNPQDSFDAVQVTGTNGKTSVGNMTAAILAECGFKVGLFTSPHLETVRERMTVNGRMISTHAFAETMEEVAGYVKRAEKEAGEQLTYFEVVTAVAYRYFEREGIDVAVLEVGMGGRWDATNVVDCDVAVITNVDIDHVNELGRTREKIASEKVGIINEGCVLVTAEARREILMIMAERCEEVGAEMRVFGRDFRLDFHIPYRVAGEAPSQIITVSGLEGHEFREIKLPMLGKHQAVNAACAVAAAQVYAEPREKASEEGFRRALESASVPGRLEILRERPLVVTDGAHNVLGVEKLVTSLTSEFDFDRLLLVVAILGDKDARGILRLLGAVADEVVVTENRSARCIPSSKLAALCRMDGIRHREEPDFGVAVKAAMNAAGLQGMVCITGSLFTVSEARIFFRYQKASREMRQDR